MIAVEMPEANRAAERPLNVIGAQVADVSLDRGIALARETEPRAMRMEKIKQARVRPVERVDAERVFARRQAERHRDEKAAFERADLRDMALDAELALAADDVAADRRGKRRGHAAHGLVPLGDVAVYGGIAGTKRHAWPFFVYA